MNILKFFRKGIFALLVAATALIACSKDSDNNDNGGNGGNGNQPDNPIEVPKGNYGVLIGEVELTSDNYQKINKDNFPAITEGKVTYDPIQRILTLDGATIEATGEEVCAIQQPEGTTATLTIVLKNSNTLNSKESVGILVKEASLRITSEGSLTINTNSRNVSIFIKKGLTIEGGCSIVANTLIVVYGTLTINRANVYVKEDGYPAFKSYGEIKLIGCKVVTPEGATEGKYDDFYTFVKDGNFCKEVKIKKYSEQAGGNIGR